ncbi:MAG: CBS domain-containing protein [Planctomycetota bacterium]
MSRNLMTIAPDAPVERAANQLRKFKIGSLPVVSKGRLSGIITESDILDALVHLLFTTESNEAELRISFDMTNTTDLFQSIVAMAKEFAVSILSFNSFEWQDRKLAVIRVRGGTQKQFVDRLWDSGCKVLDITSKKDCE